MIKFGMKPQKTYVLACKMFFDMYWTEVHRKKSSICDQQKYMAII